MQQWGPHTGNIGQTRAQQGVQQSWKRYYAPMGTRGVVGRKKHVESKGAGTVNIETGHKKLSSLEIIFHTVQKPRMTDMNQSVKGTGWESRM